MITKERLLAGLHEFIYVEEGLITLYANFSRVLVKHAGDIEKEKKEKIENLLFQLYRDSTRHKELIDNLIKDVKKSIKNEY